MHTFEGCPAFLIAFLLLRLPHHLAENTIKSDGKSGMIHRGCEDLAKLFLFFFLLSAQQIVSTDGPGLPGYIFSWCPGFTLLLRDNTECSAPG